MIRASCSHAVKRWIASACSVCLSHQPPCTSRDLLCSSVLARTHCVASNPKFTWQTCQQLPSGMKLRQCRWHSLATVKKLKELIELEQQALRDSGCENNNVLQNIHTGVHESAKDLLDVAAELVPKCEQYDPYPGLEFNGLRSILSLVNKCTEELTDQLQACQSKQKAGQDIQNDVTKLEATSHLLSSVSCVLGYVKLIIDADTKNQLIVDREKFHPRFLDEAECMDREPFYNLFIGFQYDKELQPILSLIVAALATMGRKYFNLHPPSDMSAAELLPTLQDVAKCVMDRQVVAKWFLNTTSRHDLTFAKRFWSIPEAMKYYEAERTMGGLKRCQVNQLQDIGPEVLYFSKVELASLNEDKLRTSSDSLENADLPSAGTIAVPPPLDVDGRPTTVTIRHLLPQSTSSQLSSSIVIHFHGGGFIAQTSQSHQIYLTHWANQLNAPVVSVDYSLAPESPFPRAVNDCFYAYSWVLKNCQQLGTTAKRVILAGDSAGGNFVFGVAFLAAQYKLPVPDLLLAAYPALHIALDPSPGRLQSMTDPLLPFGILKACLNAYRGPSQSTAQQVLSKGIPPLSAAVHQKHVDLLQSSVAYLSPALAPDDILSSLPEVHLLPCAFDPLVDDSVNLARRLHRRGKKVEVHPMHDLCHGFLNFFSVSKKARAASQKCVDIMRTVTERP